VKCLPEGSSDLYMKKLLMLSLLLVGAASVSQAGVRFGVELGFPLPLPRLPGVTISHPAPVYDTTPAPVCTTPETTVYQAPACPTPQPQQVYQPPVWSTPKVPVYSTPAPVIVQPSRAYFEFDSSDCSRPNPHYVSREYGQREYANYRNHYERERSRQFRDGHRW
jgi:hypothetical protein